MFAKRGDFLDITLLFFGSLILFTWGLGSQEIISFDSRFYLFVQEMWKTGLSWFPTAYHQPYPDYPATSTGLIYLLAQLFGGVNKFVAVLPSAILASLILIFTYLIGALHGKRYGFCAVFFLLLTATFIKSARSITLDLYPTLITTLCFYLIYSADKQRRLHRASWVYLFLFLGFILRGPIGLVLPAGVICSYYFLNGQIKQFFIFGCWAFLLLLVSTAILLALAYYVGGETFLLDVLRMEVLGRIDNHFLPKYFYFTDSFGSYALAFPFAVIVLIALFYVRRSGLDTSFLMKLLGWMLVVFIGMSIPGDKKVRYILPMLPAAALIAAYPWFSSETQTSLNFLRKWIAKIFLFMPLLLLCITILIYLYAHQHHFHFIISYPYASVFCIFMQVLSLFIFYSYSIPLARREVAVIGIAALNFVIIYVAAIEPIDLYFERAREFVISVENKRLENHAQLVFYKESPDGLPIKYLINMSSSTTPVFINRVEDLLAVTMPTFFVTSQSYFDELPKSLAAHFDLVAMDNLGHVPVVVFAKKR